MEKVKVSEHSQLLFPWWRQDRAFVSLSHWLTMSGLEVIPLVSIGLLGANVVLIHVSTVMRWVYTTLFLTGDSITIDKNQDRVGWSQMVFELHHFLVTQGIRSARQTLAVRVPGRDGVSAIDVRLIYPANGCFVNVPDHGVEIEVQRDYFCVHTKRCQRQDACDKFLQLLGTEMNRHDPNGHILPALRGLLVNPEPTPTVDTKPEQYIPLAGLNRSDVL